MIYFRNSSLREAILRKKAAVQDIENTLAASATGWVFVKGRWGRITPGSRQRLIDKKAHLQLVVEELEVEELLQAWRASSGDPEARTAIEKRLADRGKPLRKPSTSTPGEYPIQRKDRLTTHVGNADLGKTIGVLYEELRRLKTNTRGRRKTEDELRSAFRDFQLWKEIDASDSLPPGERQRFFGARLDTYGQIEFMDFIGKIVALEGTSTYKTWKEYRKKAGLGRKRTVCKAAPKFRA